MSPESLLCHHAHASAHARIDLHTLNKETTQVDKKKKNQKNTKTTKHQNKQPQPHPTEGKTGKRRNSTLGTVQSSV